MATFGGGSALLLSTEVWNGVVIQVPLLDMIRISRIASGASWQGEYGDVNADRAVMAFWLAEFVVTGYLSMAAYIVFKACEYKLARDFTEKL